MVDERAGSSGTNWIIYFTRKLPNETIGAFKSTQKLFVVSMRSIPAELAGTQVHERVAKMFSHTSLFA